MKTVCFLSIGLVFLFSTAALDATAALSPTYNYTVLDAVTGDNFITDQGWYVTPGADEHVNDLNRERPLGTQDFSSQSGQWVHPGKYYSYLDIVSAQWGYDSQYLYFQQTLYGNWDMDDAIDDRDYGVFGSGTFYNIIVGQRPDFEANGSVLLRARGDEQNTWATVYNSKGTEGYEDQDGDVGGSGIAVTKEDGDSAGNGYEFQAILTDGYILDSNNPEVLFARIAGADLSDDSQPVVEIAFDYQTWNEFAEENDLQIITPEDISLIVFETNRGTQDNANYLWNDKYTIGEEGAPYDIVDENGDPIDQLGNVYELDRAYWTVPIPGTVWLLGGGLIGLVGIRRKIKKR